MLDQLPIRPFFEFETRIARLPAPPRIDGKMSAWSSKYRLPTLVELENATPTVTAYAGWSVDGFGVGFDIKRGRQALQCDAQSWWKFDGVRVCIDTRDARENRRATRFCHFFYMLPRGAGRDGRGPVVGLHRMSRAREHPPGIDTSLIQVGVNVGQGHYTLEAFFPAACLHGWNPAEHRHIGFFYKVRNLSLSDEHFSATDDFGWNVDPSGWATATLAE
ncbi:MAG: hypothetical protein KDA32_09745 [Phycisphaerales bacterium]|nr:hypothetical protein [Phycisphaerales bacterium]